MSDDLKIFSPQTRDIGFPVRRLLPQFDQRAVGPFVFLDHMGPAVFPAGSQAFDVRPHPHIGIGTITYLFSGAMMHRDSLGIVQRITPGALNWMCAGQGISHSERIPEDIRLPGEPVEGIQMWIALPEALQEMPPAFEHHPKEALPEWFESGATWQLLIGQWNGRQSPLKVPSDTFYAAGRLDTGASFAFPDHVIERAVLVAQGALESNGRRFEHGTLIVLPAGASPVFTSLENSRIMLLGGASLDKPRHMWWNFVSTSRERIERAAADWNAGHFPEVPGEHERIPAPPLKSDRNT